jgi:coenzyme Q-binding protein COQ10
MPSFRTTRRLPFTPRQIFDLVADVERYPQFLPLCEALVVRSRAREGEREVLLADMTVGYKAIRETFTSRVVLDAAALTVLSGTTPGEPSGPFRSLDNRWVMREAEGGGCEVDFSIAYAFNSFAIQALVGALLDRAFRRYVRAFEERAAAIYGAGAASARETS